MSFDRFIYFIQSGGERGPVKIGITGDPQLRLKRLQTGSAEPLKLLGTVKGDEAMERAYHTRLAAHCVRGEWFRTDPEVLACIPRPFVTTGTPEGDREQFHAVLDRKLFEAELRAKIGA